MKRCSAAIGALLPLLACGEGLPLVERIASTRPLAMRVEAVEADADPVRAEALPLEQVRITPFIVDPNGPLDMDRIATEMEPRWIGCTMQPIEGLFSCLSNALPLRPEDVPDCPPFDPTMLDPENLQQPSPCWLANDPVGQVQFPVPLDLGFLLGGDYEVTMIAHVPGAGDTATCVEQLLTQAGSISRDCFLATQRVAVGPDAALLQMAVDFGIPDVSQFGVIPDEIPEPDTHPRLTSMTVHVLDAEGIEIGTFSPEKDGSSEPIPVAVGQTLAMEAIAPESDLQTYLIPRDMTEFDERTETYAGQWFVTWGTLLSATSDDPLSLNEWTIHRGMQDETDLPADGIATLFYVLRDDRQGVDWWWFRVVVSE